MPGDFIIRPVDGTFELGEVRQWLDARVDAYEDPTQPGYYAIGGGLSEPALEAREGGDRLRGALIVLFQDSISLIQDTWADDHALRGAMDFLVWLTGRYRCTVHVDGYGTDLTEQLNREGAASLYEESVRATTPFWEGKLVRVGFFWEIHPLDLPATTSLEKARRLEPIPEEAKLADYLDAGQLYQRHDEMVRDWFDDDIEIGPGHLLTDGLYVWPAELAYYVRTYHVHLPRAFVMHAKRNGWRVPEVDVSRLPELAF